MTATASWLIFVGTIAGVLARPRVASLAVPPAVVALGGAALLVAIGALPIAEVGRAVGELWRPLAGVSAVIASAAAARRLGLLDLVVRAFARAARGPVSRAFAAVFWGSYAVAAVLNNDAAVLVLTPAVVRATRALYPLRPALAVPFAFAVFGAAGVAPLVLSNPMNLVVATWSGIGFNAYAARMAPASLAVAGVTWAMLHWHFRDLLVDAVPARGALDPRASGPPPTGALALFGATLAAYPVCAALGWPTWAVALVGAAGLLAYASRRCGVGPRVLAGEVEWGILAFLFGMFLQVEALREAGLTERLRALYASLPAGGGERAGGIALASALGSAVFNNHPMALVNAAALRGAGGGAQRDVLAALVGGDLGPRLLPFGSLAGLLWLDALRREGVAVSYRSFAHVGIVTTVPPLLVGALVVDALAG